MSDNGYFVINDHEKRSLSETTFEIEKWNDLNTILVHLNTI